MNGTVGQRKIVRFEYQVSHIQCNIEPEKPRSYKHTGKAKHLTFYQLWCRCGATPQYEEGQNGRRVGFPDYTSLMICCNTSNFLEYTEFLWLGETALRPLQRNLVGS